MSDKSTDRQRPFIVVWEFRVKPGKQRAFEKAYGPDGAWVQLFRRSAAYLGTELIRDRNARLRYVTLDHWISRQAFLRFKKDNRAAYRAIDSDCGALTTREELIGEFDGFKNTENNSSSVDSTLGTVGTQNLTGGQEGSPQKNIAAKIRPATAHDAAAILALERDSPAAAHWSEPTYRRIFSNEAPVQIAFIAEGQNAELQGFVIARLTHDDCELENIVVSRQHQGRGVGTKLLQHLIAKCNTQNAARILLEVRESNAAARALYEKCGFSITGRRSAYYTRPAEDAVLYILEL